MPGRDVTFTAVRISFVVKVDLFPGIRIRVAAQAIPFVMVQGHLSDVAGEALLPTTVFISRFLPAGGVGMALDALSPGVVIREGRR
jgi:hypothetical protein